MQMESKAGKEFEETHENKEEMISISSSTQVAIRMNDEGNMATTSPSLAFPQTNPLLVDLILDVTLSKLSLIDLLSCRLVCQQWNRISTPKVKTKSSEIVFFAEDLTQEPCGSNRWSTSGHFFLSTMKNSLSIPCGKFQLRLEPSNPDLSAFQEFIDLCSNEITSLHLAPVIFGYDSHFHPGPATNKATFQNWLKTLRNLVKLTITNLDFGITSCSSFFEPENELNLDKLREFHFLECGTRGNLSSGFFDGFFKAAQNLKKLSFGVKDDSPDEEGQHYVPFDERLEMRKLKASKGLNVVLNSLLNHGRLDGIKSLTFHDLHPVNLTILVQIGEKGLKLESLQVQGMTGYGGSTCYFAFLKTQKDTLNTLEICTRHQGGRGTRFWIRFPSQMKELLKLSLSNDGPLEMWEPICYASKFPKIKQLVIQSGHRGMNYIRNVLIDTHFPEKNMRCETLKELRLVSLGFCCLSDQDRRIKEGEIIQRVSAIFPGIRVQVGRSEEYQGKMTLKVFGD